jgi:hypothetical protein
VIQSIGGFRVRRASKRDHWSRHLNQVEKWILKTCDRVQTGQSKADQIGKPTVANVLLTS